MLNVPGTYDNWYDQSAITAPEIKDTAVKPLFLTAFTSDRGPVGLRRVSGEDFYKLYGQYCDFTKHGQPLLQAARIINAGGELLCSRVTAPDATLANLIITATVTSASKQKVNTAGELLYEDAATGQETTDAVASDGSANAAINVNTAVIKYDAVTMNDVRSYADIEKQLASLIVEDDSTMTYTYPLFAVVDNGVGVSTKRFRFSTNYQLSKSVGFAVHQFIYCGTQDFDYEYVNFSTVSGRIYNDQSMSLDMTSKSMYQIVGYDYADGATRLFNKIASITGIDLSEVQTYDILLAKDIKGKALSTIEIDSTGYDLSAEIGFALESGSNGSFGDAPINASEYEAELVKVFDGTLTDDIYDLDRFQIDACIDANFPKSVKIKISELAKFRKDFFFFADLCIGADSFELVDNALYGLVKDKFTAYYFQSGTIIDPFSKRYIDVTITYAMADKLVDHFINRPSCPFCGIMYNFVFTEFIEGTMNWLPKVIPSVNQKQQLQELNVNYASIINGSLTMETEYTSQETYSQLSFINNVTIIQKVVKDVRYNCPSYRYSFATIDDVSGYKENVDKILKRYKDKFKTLETVFVQDDLMKANKIFEISLKVTHKDFYQCEIFNIYVLSTTSTTS